MTEIFYFLMDICNYAVQGFILVRLMQGILQKRFRFHKKYFTGGILWLQFMAVQLFLADAPIVKKLIYGEDMLVRNSGRSIWLIVISMGATLCFTMILYSGNWIGIVYLVIIFYALRELVRFTMYSFLMWGLDRVINGYLYGLWEQGRIELQSYIQYLTYTQVVWNFLMIVSSLLIFSWCIFKYKRYLQIEEHRLQTSEILFLSVPGVMGLALGMMLRSILFWYQGDELYTITNQHPEMSVMIPCMTTLCILSVLASAAVFRRLIEEKEEKMKAELYKSRMLEMEEHLAQVEHLYDGIRGMKHDMRHYIADMEALIGQEAVSGAELDNYLKSLRGSMERLDIRYQTGNPITDVVFARHAQMAEEREISLEIAFVYPKNMGIEAFDLGIILNNALENAIEACGKLEPRERYVKVDSYRKGKMFFITIENSFDGCKMPEQDSGLLLTSKNDTAIHGYGMKNMKGCAEKYYGKVDIKIDGKVFLLTVMLQGKQVGDKRV